MKESARLFLLPTPIGNLEDITLRAIRILKECDFILAEDTRITRKLIRHHQIENKLKSYHAHNEHRDTPKLIEKLQEGIRIAMVTDAGTPGISDPGYLLVKACIENEIKYEVLPGPTALIPALIKSGLPNDRFTFEGFLPHKKGRKSKIASLVKEKRTMIFYESPYRLLKTLKEFAGKFGPDRQASVSRELTKIHEDTQNGTLQELVKYYTQKPVKGEIVMVIAGKKD